MRLCRAKDAPMQNLRTDNDRGYDTKTKQRELYGKSRWHFNKLDFLRVFAADLIENYMLLCFGFFCVRPGTWFPDFRKVWKHRFFEDSLLFCS